MKKKDTRPVNDRSGESKAEHKIVNLVLQFIRSDLDWIGRIGVKILRLKWKERPVPTESAQQEVTPLPTGPFLPLRRAHLGDLLLWVPQKIDSVLVDDLTGGYGYSHTSIDTGEIDLPTLKPVMAEVTVGETVARKFQDQFGKRPYARIPIKKTGVDVNRFVACVLSKIGEQYDNWEALTLGRIQDPSKQVCSGLAGECLPEDERRRIAWAKRLGFLKRGSVSVHSRPGAKKVDEFISPNGFAEYYGAPKGKLLTEPDTLIRPNRMDFDFENLASLATQRHGWKFLLAGGALLSFGYLIRRWIRRPAPSLQKTLSWEQNNNLASPVGTAFHPQVSSNAGWIPEYPHPMDPA